MHRLRAHPRVFLVGLFLLFTLPMLAAWFLTREGGEWRPGATANHGILVIPQRAVGAEGLTDLAGQPVAQDFLLGKWTLLFIGQPPCGEKCRHSLYSTRQARAAMGQYMGRVQRLYVATMPLAPQELETLTQEHPDLRIATAVSDWYAPFRMRDQKVVEASHVYVIDPLGNLMMHYPRDAEVKGMLKDLKRLLRASKIG